MPKGSRASKVCENDMHMVECQRCLRPSSHIYPHWQDYVVKSWIMEAWILNKMTVELENIATVRKRSVKFYNYASMVLIIN